MALDDFIKVPPSVALVPLSVACSRETDVAPLCTQYQYLQYPYIQVKLYPLTGT